MQQHSDDKFARIIAAVATLLVLLLTLVLMHTTYMRFGSMTPAHADRGEITLDEEFIDVISDVPSAPDMTGDKPAKATADEQLQAQPTAESGSDLDNQGDAGVAPDMVTKDRESPMTVKKKNEAQAAAAAEEKKKREEEEMKRKAENEVANAFNKSSGKHNNASAAADQGNNGRVDGNATSGTLTGTGTGTVGDGWSMPAYGKVRSTVTGSVKMTLKINKQGQVVSVAFTGGVAPAATNAAVRQACEAEVRSRRFIRASYDDAPEITNAYITYTFK